ncbi:MAG: OB-fold domain-containing protein [Caulobacterales bacterium]
MSDDKKKGRPPIPTTRPLPKPTPETAHFWEGARHGELLLQRCDACSETIFPPRPFCPKCLSRDVSILKASGKGTLYSYVINQRPAAGMEAPYAIAIVLLEEGVRMMTNIVDCPQTPEALQLDMPLEVVFAPQNETISLPLFRPVSA